MGTTGPFVEDTVIELPGYPGTRTEVNHQEKYKSVPRDFTRPMPYYRRFAKSRRVSGGTRLTTGRVDCLNFGAMSWIDYRTNQLEAQMRQKAYGKLVGKLKEYEQGWAETLATRKESYSMILARVSTLTRAAAALLRRDFKHFARILKMQWRRRSRWHKSLADIWLEYHFGWEPLVKDIYAGCKMLSSDLPSARVSGTGSHIGSDLGAVVETSVGHKKRTFGDVVVRMSGDYYVDNPNRYLLNTTGLINPASLAWELVPFSFVVDWFVPVGQFLGSFTDFFGLSRKNEFTTVWKAAASTEWTTPEVPPEFQEVVESRAMVIQRTLGISVPKPTLKLYNGFSTVRGATAVSVLIGLLGDVGRH